MSRVLTARCPFGAHSGPAQRPSGRSTNRKRKQLRSGSLRTAEAASESLCVSLFDLQSNQRAVRAPSHPAYSATRSHRRRGWCRGYRRSRRCQRRRWCRPASNPPSAVDSPKRNPERRCHERIRHRAGATSVPSTRWAHPRGSGEFSSVGGLGTPGQGGSRPRVSRASVGWLRGIPAALPSAARASTGPA